MERTAANVSLPGFINVFLKSWFSDEAQVRNSLWLYTSNHVLRLDKNNSQQELEISLVQLENVLIVCASKGCYFFCLKKEVTEREVSLQSILLA